MILIEYLHNKHYVYRDLRPKNLIIDNNKSIVLFDFDRLINLDDPIPNEQRTKNLFSLFVAPEIIGDFSYEVDIYSLGYLIYFIIQEPSIKNMDSIIRKGCKFNDFPKEFTLLTEKIKECINISPQKRPKISELIDFFYVNFFSKISNQISEIQTIKSIKNIHDIMYYKYWAFISEYDNYYAQLKLDLLYDEGILIRYRNPNNNYRSTKIMTKDFNDSNLKNIYGEFKFIFIENDEQKLLQDLQKYKFITYSTSNENAAICCEKTCFILNRNVLQSVLSQFKGKIIDVTYKESPVDEDVDNFCKYYQNEINNNQFIQTTIRPISAYLIRRYLLPSYFFNDCTFFDFNPNAIEFYDRANIVKTFFSDKYMEKVKDKERQLYSPILIKQAEILSDSIKLNIQIFNKKDFIVLKQIHSNKEYSFELVFHIKRKYIFLLKRYNEKYSDINMEMFCKKSNHNCFVHFYGFLEENKKIVGFLYEYLNNGQLLPFILNNGERINQFNSLIFLIRLYRAIDHLETNHLNPLLIELSNILLDHNNIPYILYPFHLISNYNEPYDSNLLFNKIGEFIYIFFEKKEYLKDETPQSLTECSENIQRFYQTCIQKNNNLTMNDFENFIFNEFEFINFTDFYAFKYNGRLNIPIIIDLIYELLNLLIYMKRIDKLSDILLEFFNIPTFLMLLLMHAIPDLLYQVGLNYENGFKGRNYYEKAKYYYEQAIKMSKEGGHSYSYNHLGNLYEKGHGVEQDYLKAIHYYELAGNKNLYALIILGALYENGLGVQPNSTKANEYFKSAMELKNKSLVSFQIAEYYYKGTILKQNILKAIEYYKISANENNKNAMFMLGIIYENEKSNLINQDYFKAKEYYELSGEQGNSEGYVKIGDLYYNGNNLIKQNFETARIYYEKAAKVNNNPNAILKLGYMYKYGYGGLVKDENKANVLFQKYIQIQANILLNFGLFYTDGYGVEKDFSIAKEFIEVSVELGCSNAMYVIGVLYKIGEGFNQDINASKKYFKEFAKKGVFNINLIERNIHDPSKIFSNPTGYFLNYAKENSESIVNLGKLYEKGKGIKTINCTLAKKLYELGCKLNNSDAFYYLGRLYEKGNQN